MKKKIKNPFSESTMRIIYMVVGSVLSVIVLTFSVLALVQMEKGTVESASGYIFGIFIVLGLSRLLTFIKDRTKISFLRFAVLLVVDVILGILAFFAKDNTYFYSLIGGFYCLTIIASRVFKILQKRTIREIVFSSILIIFSTLLAIGLFVPDKNVSPVAPILIVCLLVTITSFTEVLSNSFSQLKLNVLFKIVLKTYAFEIILGLATLIVASALIFTYIEPTDAANNLGGNFGNSLWYAFAVVTTIGFGDFTAVTATGRVITVLLGIYGIIVVAVITSIIVNFYNETAGKHDSKQIEDIKKETQKK